MSSFDKVIGYTAIKKELMEVCDMLNNSDIYEALGAKLPQGILLYGEPGLGKTLMAKCFLEECKLAAYTIRRNKCNNDFVSSITDTFDKAKANAPSVVFLDDIDKFANEDYDHRDAEEYVAIQSGIDNVKDQNVFILATANDRYRMPDSLIRAGRFDRKIKFQTPNKQDALDIINYYLSRKTVSSDVNMEDLGKMFSYSSCAELETIINEAAIAAGGKRKREIEMLDIIEAVLRSQYDSPDEYANLSREEIEETALHEAGHVVVAEVLVPGSIGLASIRPRGRNDKCGFVHSCEDMPKNIQNICTSLAGKIAVEMYYAEASAVGCQGDLNKAAEMIKKEMTKNASLGIEMLDISDNEYDDPSESFNSRAESVIHVELERMMLRTKDILIKNRGFLEKVRDELVEKETLLYSDIQRIRNSSIITNVEL